MQKNDLPEDIPLDWTDKRDAYHRSLLVMVARYLIRSGLSRQECDERIARLKATIEQAK